jgi:PDZ domain-containing protein
MRLLVIDRRYVDALSALPPAPRRRRRWRPFACVLAAVAIAAAGGVLYHPPVAVLEPGAAFDVSRDITIAGARVYPVSGRYLVTPVRVVRPNGIRVLLALGRPDREVLPAARARAGERERQRQVFRTSERLAAAAAGANGVHIEFRDRDVGGPSAGLIYALAIADLLGPEDIANGRTIAATGTIDAEGNVGSVCCMEQKAESALDAGAGLMLVPAGESEASSFMAVIEVSTLREALARLSR